MLENQLHPAKAILYTIHEGGSSISDSIDKSYLLQGGKNQKNNSLMNLSS